MWCRLAVVDLHVGREQGVAILVREQQDRLGEVPDVALGEARLVVVDQRDDVASRNVAEVDDGETGRVEVAADGGDVAGRNGRADRPRVQQVRETRDRRCTSRRR